jgi:ferredoxin-thioredoxin reductase catalytic subunit
MESKKVSGVKEDPLARVQQEVRHRLEEWLKGTPYRFNPDTSTVDTIVKGLALRRLKYGEEYCPCRVVKGDAEENKGIICPCIYHEEEIAQEGICFCGLFVGPNYKPA